MRKIIALVSSALLVVALAAVVFVPVARAHAEIEECTPPIDGTVETAPEKLTCKASQGMKAEGSALKVFDANGVQVDKGDSAVDLNDPDRVTISVSLDMAKMEHGVYTVKWTTVSADDGDEADGEFKFTVGHAMMEQATPAATDEHTEGGTHDDDHSMASGTIDGKAVTLQILAPAQDAMLTAGDVKIEAKVEGITLGENDTHLHFYVNDKLAGMGEGAQTTMTVNLEPGTYDLQVGLATGGHEDVLKAHVHVTVDAAAQATATAPAPTAAATPEPAATATPAAPATTLPATGGGENYALIGLLALFGVIVFGVGAFGFSRVRR